MVSELTVRVGHFDQVVYGATVMFCRVVCLTIIAVIGYEQNMAGRNDAALAATMLVMAQAVRSTPNAGGNEEFRKNKPPIFKGRYNPDGAQIWLKEIERIFRVMDCAEEQKVRLGTHMLQEEADDWWVSTRHVWEATGEVVTWALFSREFLRKYFPEDVRGKKEIEFLELKLGNMSVTDYTAKFV